MKSETDPNLSKWYKENTLIYVSPDHACWSNEEAARKVRKNRFGKVVQADIQVGRGFGIGGGGTGAGGANAMGGSLNAMLRRHESDSFTWVKRQVRDWERSRLEEETDEDEELMSDELGAKDTVMGDVPGAGMDVQSMRVPVGS